MFFYRMVFIFATGKRFLLVPDEISAGLFLKQHNRKSIQSKINKYVQSSSVGQQKNC